ncbi:MAG TPA: BMP family ABC transporter substrate-binding protein, partial [Pseudogracilibacillus sp.]|nr:BMP family ABC transporter substrate-binding protein [Pseudogracilibacillus sp.]
MRKYLITLLTVLFAILVLSACAGDADSDAGTDDGADTETETDTSTEEATEEGSDGDKPYIALVSKGFQHQFWQSVKEGAEQAAE